MALTTNQGLDIPDGSDNANVPLSFVNYNTGLENRLVQRYLSIADRTARNPAPFEGELSYLADLNRFDYFTGTTWLNLIPAASYGTDGNVFFPTSLTYTTVGATVIGGSVTVPPSGQIEVTWNSGLNNTVAGNATWVSVQINTGSTIGGGVPLVVASDVWGLFSTGAAGSIKTGTFYLFTGLAPGTVVNAFLMHRVSGGTGTVERRNVKVLQA